MQIRLSENFRAVFYAPFYATLALGLGLVFASGVTLAEDAPAPATAAATAAPAPAAAPAVAEAAPAPVPNKGDTAWMTVATILVILMTIPGLALFYGGLVRSKNMLSVLMQVFVVSSVQAPALAGRVCGRSTTTTAPPPGALSRIKVP